MNNNISQALKTPNNFLDVNTAHSLEQVSGEIQQAMDVVDNYKKKIENVCPPVINGQPWYKFSFGKASVNEVNKVMESFSNFVHETFKLVAFIQDLQNENDMNICRLIGLLALAESNSYDQLHDISAKIKDLATEDEESVRQLKELEDSFLKSLNDSAIDTQKKNEQMSTLIKYITLSADSKTKKIRALSLKLSELETQLDKYTNVQDKWISDTKAILGSWQLTISEDINKLFNQLKDTTLEAIAKELHSFNNRFDELNTNHLEIVDKQATKLSQEMKKQKDKVDEVITILNDKIECYQKVIEEQNKTIATQNDSLMKQKCINTSLKGKILYALLISSISALVAIGCMAYIII